MKYRAGSSMLHCVLFSLFSVLLKPVVAQVTTLYGIEPAFEGAFLTEAFQSTSIGVGTDGVITVVDHAATDPILAHGTYGVTLRESSNGLVFDASGTVYSEHMSCALDTKASLASCVFTQSIGGSTIVGTFTPTALPVAVVTRPPASSSKPTSSLQTSSTPSQTSSSSNSGGSSLSSGALAGIIVAIVLAVIILLGLIFWLVVLRRRRHRVMQETEAMHEDVERQDHVHRITPFSASSAMTPGLTSPHQPSSPLSTSADESNSSSGMSEKRRMFFAANNNIDQPASPPPNSLETRSAVQSIDTRAPSEYSQSNTASDVDARRILDEMRRMRAEVAELRTQAIPPEYSE